MTVEGELKLFGSVRDEGLPKGGAVTAEWRMVSGPGTTTFADATSARTLARFSTNGTYELELLGSDTVFDETVQVTVVVAMSRQKGSSSWQGAAKQMGFVPKNARMPLWDNISASA